MDALSFILSVIEGGYLLPFVSCPEPAVFKNNRSSLSHAEFVEEAIRPIQDLVEWGPVVEINVPTRVVNPCPYLFKLMERRGSFLI